MRRLSLVREKVAQAERLEAQLADLEELLELEDEGLAEELAAELEGLEKELAQLEDRILLSGEYDDRDALLSIHAGAGGTEAQDWAEMLLRMYLRWADQAGYKTQVLDLTPGEEAGIKSVTVEVKGPYAYGYLQSEKGVHRLVRISPFDAAKRRHTSFALVEVMPSVEEDPRIEIRPEDLKIEFFRASGHGGQHVNMTDSAVRITHLPTGIVVSCQNERSQHQNRATAMKILKARLLEHELQRQQEEMRRLKGEHVSAGWGNQIRSYVLHPYKMVKDLRTGYETSDTQRVLDGDLTPFMEAYLRWQAAQGERKEVQHGVRART